MVVAVPVAGPADPAVLGSFRVKAPERVGKTVRVGESPVEVVLERGEERVPGLVPGFEDVEVPLRVSALGRSYRSRQLPGGGPGLTRKRGAGFLVHRDEPGEAGSYSPSAGVLALRPTDGELEQIPRRVHVPAGDQAARGACIRPLGQEQLGFHRSASRARLAGGEPAVSQDQPAAVPSGLVGQHPPGLAEALIGDGAGKPPVPGHPCHVQVLGGNRLVPGRQFAGGLVQRISPDVRHASVDAGEGSGMLTAVSRAARLTGMRAAGPPQLPQRSPKRLRAADSQDLPSVVYARQQDLNPQVNADSRAGPGGQAGMARSASQLNDTNQR